MIPPFRGIQNHIMRYKETENEEPISSSYRHDRPADRCMWWNSEPRATPMQKVRIAVVMPSAITDMAFSQSMYDALKAVQTEMGGE